MAVLSPLASTTTAADRSLSLAITSSAMMRGTCEDQPRIERVAALDHGAVASAQVVDALVDGVGDEADEGARQEDAGERDDEAEQAGGPGDVGGERAGVEGAEHRLPQLLGEAVAVGPAEGELGGERDERGHDHDGHAQQRQVGDDDHRPPSKGVVEPVAQAGTERRRRRSPAARTAGGGRRCHPGATVDGLALPSGRLLGGAGHRAGQPKRAAPIRPSPGRAQITLRAADGHGAPRRCLRCCVARTRRGRRAS